MTWLAATWLKLPVLLVQSATWLLLVGGIGGDDEHRAAFAELGDRLIAAAMHRGLPAEHIVQLAESVELSPRARARSTRDEIERALDDLRASSSAGDNVVIVMVGHGTARGNEAYFNLPGPDLSGTELASLLEPLGDRQVTVVNTAAASGGFVAALAAPGRVVITATRGTRELLEPSFVGFFVEAFEGDGADLDKDGAVSMLEAFRFANLGVERLYDEGGRLRTEHAQLDDDGDGKASENPSGDPDGALAATISLGGAAATADSDDEELRALRQQRTAAEQELALLRSRREAMSDADYETALETILVRIAEIDAAIRARGGQR